MVRERRLFSEEFKRAAAKLAGQSGVSKAGIARDLGVGANLLGRWCREANVAGHVGGGEKVSSQGFERMRRELGEVKTERDILKKALGYFAAGLKLTVNRASFRNMRSKISVEFNSDAGTELLTVLHFSVFLSVLLECIYAIPAMHAGCRGCCGSGKHQNTDVKNFKKSKPRFLPRRSGVFLLSEEVQGRWAAAQC
jgi:transposase